MLCSNGPSKPTHGCFAHPRAGPHSMKGQFITVLLIGLLSTGAWLAIGLPSPFGLGLIAFIPYVGGKRAI